MTRVAVRRELIQLRQQVGDLSGQVAMLTVALESAQEYLDATLSPCKPDCECVLHIVEVALAATRGEQAR